MEGLIAKQVQDIVDHGTHKHEMEEAEFAKIEAKAELDRKEASGIRGKVSSDVFQLVARIQPPSQLMDLLDPRVGDKVRLTVILFPCYRHGLQVKELWGKQTEEGVVKEEGLTDKVTILVAVPGNNYQSSYRRCMTYFMGMK